MRGAHVSARPDIVDTDRLAEALLLADPDDADSLVELRALLEGLLPWPDDELAELAERGVRECLTLLDGADGAAVERVTEILAPVLEAAAVPPQERRQAGATAAGAGEDAAADDAATDDAAAEDRAAEDTAAVTAAAHAAPA